MENSDSISKEEAVLRYQQAVREQSQATLKKLEEREKELREKRDVNRQHIMMAAEVALSAYGLEQIKYELYLRSVRLEDPTDPILEPLFDFYERYTNHMLPSSADINLAKSWERKVFDAIKGRIAFREKAHFFNPVSIETWTSYLESQPLDSRIDDPKLLSAFDYTEFNFDKLQVEQLN